MKRSDLKYLKLIPGKGWSKNKPTCENAISQMHAPPGNGLLFTLNLGIIYKISSIFWRLLNLQLLKTVYFKILPS